MTDREDLQVQLNQLQEKIGAELEKYTSACDSLGRVIGTHDLALINSERDSVQLTSEILRSLTDEQRSLQRRLEFLTTEELTRNAIEVTKSASRAAWVTCWIAVAAMVVTTSATIVAAFIR